MDRGFPYPLLRAATNVALRALGTSLILEEMYRGTPVIYADFTDYDEIAHHSGPERPDALDAIDGIDRVLGTLSKAAADAARPYRFVVLSDHGQTLGATFRQRFGETLEQAVRRLVTAEGSIAAATAQVEEWGPLNAMASELARSSGLTGRMTRVTMARQGAADGTADAGLDAAADLDAGTGRASDRGDSPPRCPDVVVCASGNLGLVSFPNVRGRMTLEAIDVLHAGLIDGLAAHAGIAFVMVRSAEGGAVCIGRYGRHYLDRGGSGEPAVEGVDPLASFGDLAAASLRNLDQMANVPDIVVISMYDAEADEVAAFEELIGSHGGLGGAQTRAFLLAPSDWPAEEAPLVGAPAVHAQLRRWLEAASLATAR
jgi:hypothetical protein